MRARPHAGPSRQQPVKRLQRIRRTAGTIVHDLMVYHPDTWFWFRVNLVDGQTLAFIEQDGTRYRILNPEPLIEFLQSRVSFDV